MRDGFMEKETPLKTENIDNLIALCHILDNYSEFAKKLTDLVSTKSNINDVYNLNIISHGKFVFGARKVKKFYKENKDIIDTINKYSKIDTFIYYSYDFQGNLSEDASLEFFYQYFLTHKNELEQILSVLEKLKELGFDKLEFDEEKDFTQDEYEVDTTIGKNFDITYLDNIQVVPNYQKNVVKYRTTGSNFSIVKKVSRESSYNTITLNSLVFNVNRLPESIDKATFFDRLINLKEEQKEDCATIRNSVDLSISISDLQSQYESTSRTIEKLEDISSKDELIDTLSIIKEYIDKLQIMSSEYDDCVSKEDSSITKEKLQQEKQMYLKRKSDASIDTTRK